MRYFIIVLIILICSCKKLDEFSPRQFRIYTIEEGRHKSESLPSIKLNSKYIEFEALFNSSCIYNIGQDQSDINKLYGFSNGTNHLENSARFGWRWYNNELQILAYTHIDSKIQWKYITTIDYNKIYSYKLSITNNNYVFTCNNTTVELPASGKGVIRYYLFPYFGGNKTAPHKITITIKEK